MKKTTTVARSSAPAAELACPIQRKIAIVGLGYVGLQLAAAFGQHQEVMGFDIDRSRIAELSDGYDKYRDFTSADLAKSNASLTANPDDIKDCDFYIIAVPTPITADKVVDLGPLSAASEIVGNCLNEGDIVVYESTVYPGLTEEHCVPILERASGLKSPTGFAVGYSPERISYGDPHLALKNSIKLISAQNEQTLRIMRDVYGAVVDVGLSEVSSIRVAESAKLVENIQRDVNIALMNELAIIFNSLGISTKEVLEAAQTKHNFVPFKPGLVGGHCISVDPYYLIHKASQVGCSANLLLASRLQNDSMPGFIVNETVKRMADNERLTNDCRIGILGITFKENCADIRDSRAAKLVQEFQKLGVQPIVHDPVADPKEVQREYGIELSPLDQLQDLSAIIIAVAHDQFASLTAEQYKSISRANAPIADIKGLYEPIDFEKHGLHLWQL